MTMDELPGYLLMLAARAGEAAIPASNAMSEDFTKVVKRRLTERSHVRGTRTPSPAGEPPATEAGQIPGTQTDHVARFHLAASVAQVPAATPVVATSSVSPHTEYDWVQEYGLAGITPSSKPYMRFYYDGWQKRKVVTVPERSYMRSTVDLMVANGSLTRDAAEAFYAAMWG